jgi:hypothetical protein
VNQNFLEDIIFIGVRVYVTYQESKAITIFKLSDLPVQEIK